MSARRWKLGHVSHVMNINGIDVYFHWSVFVIIVVIALNGIRHPWLIACGLGAYLGVLLIHELGHALVARRRGCEVFRIEIWPIHGLTVFRTPWSELDSCAIAWGGVLAQAAVAVPLVIWIVVVGYTRFEPLNAILAILGGYSLLVAVFNLLPVWHLDGATAWQLFPAWFRQKRTLRAGAHRNWR